jgi:hypothetical protein
VGNLRIAVGKVTPTQTASGSLTVIVVLDTANTVVYGPIMLGPIKSPTKTVLTAEAEVVITPVPELNAVALIPIVDGIAPTHCATRLTRALPDWIKRAIKHPYFVGTIGL